MAGPKKGLGNGLSRLFGDDDIEPLTGTPAQPEATLLLSHVEPNPDQPRKRFDEEALRELAESIKQHGIITPITVRAGKKVGYYQIIAGERRWRAARMAGLEKIPVHIIEADEGKVMELALIENLQREDLDPIEEAEGYSQLIEKFGLTQEQVAAHVSKSRPAIANAMRLLVLPVEVQKMVSTGLLSSGHARAVLAVADAEKRVEAAKKMQGLSVRQAEAMAKKMNQSPIEEPKKEEFIVDYASEVAKELEGSLGRKVVITEGKTSGSLTMEFYGADDLERLTEALKTLRV